MKTPISYYGGKQKLLPVILPLVPEHRLYAETFCGGSAVFFAKQPSEIEVLNDTNTEVINFYRQAKTNFKALEREIKATLHSRVDHRKACVINTHPEYFSELQRAWALWVLSTQSFSAIIGGSFGFDRTKNTTTNKIHNKKAGFTAELAGRLERAQLEAMDALYIIKSRDSDDSFFYCDPPYFNSDCGHYGGYTEVDFENLLIALSRIKGKFLLSCYPSDVLTRYIKANKWVQKTYEQGVSVNTKSGYQKRKWECLVANYPIEK